MKKILIYLLINIVTLISISQFASTNEQVPPNTFSINNVEIGVSTLSEAQKHFGITEIFRVTQEDESDIRICYSHSLPQSKAYLIFESGSTGSFQNITGFKLSLLPQQGNCKITNISIESLRTGNGVKLGQSIDLFMKLIPANFKKNGDELIYENLSQRLVTQDELKKIRKVWPGSKQDYFDVLVTIKAKFHDKKLVDFYIKKIESY